MTLWDALTCGLLALGIAVLVLDWEPAMPRYLAELPGRLARWLTRTVRRWTA